MLRSKVNLGFANQVLFGECKFLFMELMMQNFLVAAVLVGMGLFASQAHASELKIGSWGGNVRSGPSTDYP